MIATGASASDDVHNIFSVTEAVRRVQDGRYIMLQTECPTLPEYDLAVVKRGYVGWERTQSFELREIHPVIERLDASIDPRIETPDHLPDSLGVHQDGS